MREMRLQMDAAEAAAEGLPGVQVKEMGGRP